jgi:Flp pilus assembly protein TadD
LAALTLALMLDPNLDAAKIAVANQQSALQHFDAALTALRAVSDASDYASSARVMEAWTLMNQGQRDEALALIQRVAATGDLRAKRTLGDMYRQAGRYSEAEAVFDELIAAHPDDWRLYFARGAVRMKLEHVDAAEADMQHAITLSPDQAEVLNYLGYSWVDRGAHLPEALTMIQHAAALSPDSAAIIDSLGWAYFRMGDYQNALDALEHAVALAPGVSTLNEHLGDVYWRLNRRIEARYQWRHALALSPDDADALRAKLAHGLPSEGGSHTARPVRRR